MLAMFADDEDEEEANTSYIAWNNRRYTSGFGPDYTEEEFNLKKSIALSYINKEIKK